MKRCIFAIIHSNLKQEIEGKMNFVEESFRRHYETPSYIRENSMLQYASRPPFKDFTEQNQEPPPTPIFKNVKIKLSKISKSILTFIDHKYII